MDTARSSLLALISILPGPAAAQVRQAPQTAGIGRVIVYVRNQDVSFRSQSLAQLIADRIFSSIGVRIDWRCGVPPAFLPELPIAVDLSIAPKHHGPHPIAYALPYEGVHVQIFYDRIEEEPNPAVVLGHVFAHEITHILQGVIRHSESGIMKARWTAAELDQMAYKDLPFTPEDVQLIHMGIVARTRGGSAPPVENADEEVADSHY